MVTKILKNILRSFILTSFLVVMPAYVSAQVPIEKELRIYRVEEVAGPNGVEERLVEVDSPIPGAVCEYELTYRNISGKNLDGIVIRQPIPANGTYIYGSATAPEDIDIYVSADNGISFQPESGLSQEQDAESDTPEISDNAFRALQWVFRRPLAADENLTLRYRVIAE